MINFLQVSSWSAEYKLQHTDCELPLFLYCHSQVAIKHDIHLFNLFLTLGFIGNGLLFQNAKCHTRFPANKYPYAAVSSMGWWYSGVKSCENVSQVLLSILLHTSLHKSKKILMQYITHWNLMRLKTEWNPSICYWSHHKTLPQTG